MNPADDLIKLAWQARGERRYEDAKRGLLEAIKLSRQADSRLDLIRALKALAHIVRDQGQVDCALPLYEEAMALSRAEGDDLVLAHSVRHFGDLHREAGRIADAQRYYDEALSLYRAALAPPALDFANALRPAAMLKEAEGDIEAARQLWTEARLLYERADVRPGVEECNRRLSELG